MNPLINVNSALPLYKQVAEIFYNRIESKEWKEDERIPSEQMLMDEFDVSRITIRKAISELEEGGLLVRSRGRGTYVSAAPAAITASGDVGFTRSCQMSGRKADNIVLESKWEYASGRDKKFFGIKGTAKIIMIRRLRLVDKIPTVIEILKYAPEYSLLLDADVTGSVTELFASLYPEVKLGSAQRTVEACASSADESKLLNAEEGTPMLLIRDTQYDSNEKPLFLSKQVFKTDYLKLYL